ncbi:fungal-specific transcription factor domain-containing protein [Exophiala viscosa]|uniref:fungal-specific transcription factor domain-containing protein n=1 Tax=Exophiala viscosa TaxID=2486360 RepID=UPI00219A66E8|nr:fungal-specific transcription factor domain-containing protein [Exophiala viscosa]
MERPYRSRKQRPCDKCRVRKVFCSRQGNASCALCRNRGIDCTVEGVAMSETVNSPIVEDDGALSVVTRIKSPQRRSRGAASGDSQHPLQSSESMGMPTRVERFVGLSSDLDPFILRHYNWKTMFADDDEAPFSYDRRGKDPYTPIHFELSMQNRLETSLSQSCAIPLLGQLEPFQQDLFQTFDRYIHPSYPLLGPKRPHKATAAPILKIAICSVAHKIGSVAQKLPSDVFNDFNILGLPTELRLAQLETIEGALLFQQRNAYNAGFPEKRGSHLETGNLVAATQDLGLNIDCTGWEIPIHEKRRRRRIWWAVFIQDKWSALALGRPPYLTEAHTNVTMLERSDFAVLGEEDPSDNVSQGADVFIATVHLTHILAMIIATFYSVRGLDNALSFPVADIQSLFEKYSRDLDHWAAAHFEPLAGSTGSIDVTGGLELAAYTVRIILFRAILPKLDILQARSMDLRHEASLTIKQVTIILRNLTISRTSVLWWPMPHTNLATIRTFIVSMILSSTEDADADSWTAALTSYQELLKAHSAGFPVTRYAAAQAEQLPLNTNQSTPQSSP